jgi:hypothetical protein
MAMKSKQMDATELEAELMRLNALVRERRQQLARLKNCPNQHCPCRVVWRDVVEKGLASQVGKIRRNVRSRPGAPAKPKRRARNPQ